MTKQEREEILKNDLSDLKSGQCVFCLFGDSYEGSLVSHLNKSLILSNGYSFTLTGRESSRDANPRVFKSLDHCIRYFTALKEEQEEASVWTWEKIQKCEKIGFGSGFERHEYNLNNSFIISKSNRMHVEKIEFWDNIKNETNAYTSQSFHWGSFKFYDRQGTLIDPREY